MTDCGTTEGSSGAGDVATNSLRVLLSSGGNKVKAIEVQLEIRPQHKTFSLLENLEEKCYSDEL